MAKFMVRLTAQAAVEALVLVDAPTADEAGDKAVSNWREADWEVSDVPYKSDIDTPCVDVYEEN